MDSGKVSSDLGIPTDRESGYRTAGISRCVETNGTGDRPMRRRDKETKRRRDEEIKKRRNGETEKRRNVEENRRLEKRRNEEEKKNIKRA